MSITTASAPPADLALAVIGTLMERLSEADRRTVARALAGRYAEDAVHESAPRFSPRHWQALRLLASGKTTVKIAADMGITRYTLMNYVSEMNKLMGTASRVALVSEAYRRGML